MEAPSAAVVEAIQAVTGWQEDRGRQLPPEWRSVIVPEVKRRAATKAHPKGQCQKLLPRSGKRCPRAGTDVDHKGNRDNHGYDNLQLLCEHHHDQKTTKQGHAGWAKKKAKRPPEQHPGRNLG